MPLQRTSRDSGPVLAIGRQAFINCPGGREDHASLVDEKGTEVLGSLIDGAEVEIVAWQPRGSATRYFVRATRHEVTGWLGMSQLRTTREPASARVTPISEPAAVWVPPRQPAAKRRK